MTAGGQLAIFLRLVVSGAILGFLFDLYRVLRALFRPRRAGPALDLLFWLLVTPVAFALLLVSNWAQLRLYVPLALAAGLYLYFQFLSAAVLRAGLALRLALARLLGLLGWFGLAVARWLVQVQRRWEFARRWGPRWRAYRRARRRPRPVQGQAPVRRPRWAVRCQRLWVQLGRHLRRR